MMLSQFTMEVMLIMFATTTTNPRPTEAFRKEHAEIKVHLDHLRDMAGDLAAATPDKQKKIMATIVGFLKDHIGPHAKWEERVLYPLADKQRHEKSFTQSMRYEHRIIERWIGELAGEMAKPAPKAVFFARRTDNLLGLIAAHFEEEEEVLLPVLDETMTVESFKRAISEASTPAAAH